MVRFHIRMAALAHVIILIHRRLKVMDGELISTGQILGDLSRPGGLQQSEDPEDHRSLRSRYPLRKIQSGVDPPDEDRPRIDLSLSIRSI